MDRNKPICLLLIHGFGGSTKEIRPLQKCLKTEGMPVFTVTLPGHGEGVKTAENVPWQKWVARVNACINKLEQRYTVVPVGFSMGGLIVAMLAAKRSFCGVVFINTPIYFWNLPQVLKNFTNSFAGTARYYLQSAGQVTPYACLQFLLLHKKASTVFDRVDCPALVVQARDDDSVWPVSARFICKKIHQPQQLYLAAGGAHQVLANPVECQIITQKIIELCSTL